MVYKYGKRKVGFNLIDLISSFSTVTWLIVFTTVVSIVFFVLSSIYCSGNACFVFDFLALKPSNILQGNYLWALITHMFVHGSFAHLLINMFVLFSLGGLCQKIIGSKRFIWFYLISGLFAGVLSVLLSGFFGFGFGARIFGSSEIFMVGASGAIFAIAGLYTVLLPRLRFSIIFFPFISFPGYILIPLVLFGVWVLSIVFNWPVGNVAHFGGYVAGLVYGFYLKKKYKRKIKMLRKMVY